MNILFFTYDFPYPTNSGGKTRAFNMLKFGLKNANVTLFSFARDSYKQSNAKYLQEIGVEDIYVFPRRKVVDFRNAGWFLSRQSLFASLYFDKEIMRKLFEIVKTKRIDLVHFESFYTGYYISKVFSDMGVKQVFGTENIEYLLYEGNAKYHPSSFLRSFYKRQAEKIKFEEERFYAGSDRILAVTKGEKRYIESNGYKKVNVIENGIDEKRFVPTKEVKRPDNTLLFLGNFSYFPNVDGMRYFMREVFPLLSPTVRLVVVGRKSSSQNFLKHDRVVTKEFVEDLSELYGLGSVFISPIRIGGGTNFKVLEAMASGLPVVALAERIEALDFSDHKELLIATGTKDFSEKIAALLTDPSLREKLAKNAASQVKKNYGWTDIGEKLYNAWRLTLNEKS